MECGLGHLRGDPIQKIPDVLRTLLQSSEVNHLLQTLGNFFVLESVIHDLGVKADG